MAKPESPAVHDSFGGASPEAECYAIQVDRSTHRELGIEVDPDSLEVEAVDAGGLIARWNQSFPSRAVRAGDRILDANGRRGADNVLHECQLPKALVLTLQRGHPTARTHAEGDVSVGLPGAAEEPRISTAGRSPRNSERKATERKATANGAQPNRVSASASVSSAGNSRGSRGSPAGSRGRSELGRDSELSELIAAAPSRLSEPLRLGFARLKGELATVEQRLDAQRKTHAQLMNEVQPMDLLQQQLQEQQEKYRENCARAPRGDTQHLKRLGEAQTRTREFMARLKTLVLEAEDLRRQRLAAHEALIESRQRREASAEEKTRLAELATDIREKCRRKEALERDLPNYLSTIRENGVMRGRLSSLKANATTTEPPSTPRKSKVEGPSTPRPSTPRLSSSPRF